MVNGENINLLYGDGLCQKIYQNNWREPTHNKYCYSLS